MLKLIIILVIVYFIGSLLWVRRVLSGSNSASAEPVELKPCEFCGTMLSIDKAVKVQGQIFCSQEHANLKR